MISEEDAKATLLFCSDFQSTEEVDPYENLSSVPLHFTGRTSSLYDAGDTILIPDHSKKSGGVTDYYTEETLNFTYLNAGYIGYVKESK